MVTAIGTRTFLPTFALTDNNVHIWSASLEQPARVVRRLAAVLSEDERSRAERFHFANHRSFFIVGRGMLRTLLARYLKLNPQEVQFEYTQNRKPFLSPSHGVHDLCFNLSHSAGIAMYALSQNRRLGIDIEYVRSIPDMDQIAASNFSEEENLQFRTVDTNGKRQAFYNCWTRKEAFIKAIGDGLSFPLDQFDVSLIPGEPARLLSIFGSEQAAGQWSMHELQPAEGYVAALVVEGNGCSISYQEWTQLESIHSVEEPK
ncbi:MAG: 4'-phosphopantetheinyl transferase superfamily protein [Chloroflexota bacterium]